MCRELVRTRSFIYPGKWWPATVSGCSEPGWGVWYELSRRARWEPVRPSWLLYTPRVGLDFIPSSVESCWMIWSYTRNQHEHIIDFILAVAWRMDEMGTSMEGREQAVVWEVTLGWFAGCLAFALQIYPLPFPIPSSTSEVGLGRL